MRLIYPFCKVQMAKVVFCCQFSSPRGGWEGVKKADYLLRLSAPTN